MEIIKGTPEEVAAYLKLMNIANDIQAPALPQQEQPKAKSISQEVSHRNLESLGKVEMEVYQALRKHGLPINSNLLHAQMQRLGSKLSRNQVSSALSHLCLYKKYVGREGTSIPYSYFIEETVDGN
jgi:hypothetical protein